MSESLKPCPFCGSAPTMSKHRYSDETGERTAYIAVECNGHSTGSLSDPEMFVGVHAEDEQSAIAAWNRRSPSPSDAAGAGEVEKIAHIICQHMEPDGPCLGCNLSEKGPRGGVRGCILAATNAAKDVLAFLTPSKGER